MMEISISVNGLQALAAGLRQAPAYTDQVLRAAMTEATLLAQREWQDNLPRVSGLTAKSITSDVASTPAGVLGVVGSSQPSARWIELGTKPHPVSEKGREALAEWAVKKLGVSKKEAPGVAFLIARKIASEGTPAQHPMGRAVAATEGQIVAMFERAANQIAEHLVQEGA